MSVPVRIAVIGLGAMGRTHAENLQGRIPGAVLGAVADPHIEKINANCLGLSAKLRVDDYRYVLDQSDLDAVVVASSSTSHGELLKALVKRRWPVFCEKPLALTLEESLEIHRLYETAGVPLQMGFMRRFDPHYLKAKAVIDRGEIGTPYHFFSISRDRMAPALEIVKHSGGFFLDTGVHDIDLARWFLGTELTEVFARGGVYNHPDYRTVQDVDHAHMSFKTVAGAMGLVELSRDAVYGYEIRTEILGTKGAVKIAAASPSDTVVMVESAIKRDTFSDYQERFQTAYLNEMSAFVKVVRGEQVPLASIDGIRATSVAQAAQRSLASGRNEMVDLPI
ncbi:MAG: inositol 2-dehydrogenase [Sulfobacillus acidophilus]|uniref:Inositol 2-dehydrogenase n=1 Tax=Sulfobacillus acidophilus TaxID=53633 RepID=A0A2T2WN18_9FIRM|nr:MAG: inositol 2-dehydrogenase [Sulfobacillus acidophilus]